MWFLNSEQVLATEQRRLNKKMYLSPPVNVQQIILCQGINKVLWFLCVLVKIKSALFRRSLPHTRHTSRLHFGCAFQVPAWGPPSQLPGGFPDDADVKLADRGGCKNYLDPSKLFGTTFLGGFFVYSKDSPLPGPHSEADKHFWDR